MDLPASARLYLRPTQFVDTPIGHDDGSVARLAGGLCWFAAWELIAVEGQRRVLQRTIPVADLPADERLQAIAARVTAPRAPLRLGERVVRLDQPQVMAILNLTPDSFSDGGKHVGDPAAAAQAGVDMTVAGAAIVDVGGESTRPGAATVWEGDEIQRIVPVVERLARSGTAVSIDTRKAAVMEAGIGAGAHLINDVSALLYDDRALGVAAQAGCPVVLMHSPDPRKTGHEGGNYGDVLVEVYDWLARRVEQVVAGGIAREHVLIDPGIGFGKSLADNLALLNGLALFHGIGCGIVLGASRKRMIGALSNEAPAEARLGGSLAVALKGAELGAQLIRVHDVFETAQALRIWRGMRDAALVARN
ncbi:dihydropteroate synthase [Sphingomonas naasensis]|uniref:dihydropteroate synthase n=1 Tax=Sphingomonas naasensis TaxID=1344951 RepID=A0A4S1WJ03_9SPHN|nr:dihydropteroate synthase [Sphingomonas naasensis]NIJ22017.1 dihydropteroate synthase [Sphingomonas naasensis]TGX42305.1 dihydropteroate synthase [Sphingomonas naasensis]